MALALIALTSIALASEPAPPPPTASAPPTDVQPSAPPPSAPPSSAPPSSTPPPSTTPPPGPSPSPTVPADPPVAEPEPVPPATPITPAPSAIDRVELRNGGIVEGHLIEFIPKSHMKIQVQGTTEIRTFNWAEVDYVERADGSREVVSAGKPTIAELAAESERIERKVKLGLGLAYGGYSTLGISLLTWAAFAFTQERTWLVAAGVSTSFTAGLLTSGGVIFFRARAERKELREVILSARPLPGGGALGVSGRF